jgi:hypothetical protein
MREQKPVICPTLQAVFSSHAGWIDPTGLKGLTKSILWRDGFGLLLNWRMARALMTARCGLQRISFASALSREELSKFSPLWLPQACEDASLSL